MDKPRYAFTCNTSVNIISRIYGLVKKKAYAIFNTDPSTPASFIIIKLRIPRWGILNFGAGGGGRTRTVSLPLDFESSTSANSITPAY